MIGNRDEFLAVLDDVIKERIKDNEYFYDFEQGKVISAFERYNSICDEIARISENIFNDEEYYYEQFSYFTNYKDYIKSMVDAFLEDDSDLFSKLILGNLIVS